MKIIPFCIILLLAYPLVALAENLIPAVMTKQEISPQNRQIPLASIAQGNLTNPIIWTKTTALEETNTHIILQEPLKYANGEIAIPKGSSIIVRVAEWDNSGFVTLEAIAISDNFQEQFKQTVLPPKALLIRDQDNQPLTFKTRTQGSDFARNLAEDALESGLRQFPYSSIARNLFRGNRNSRRDHWEFYYLEAGTVSVYINSFLKIEP